MSCYLRHPSSTNIVLKALNVCHLSLRSLSSLPSYHIYRCDHAVTTDEDWCHQLMNVHRSVRPTSCLSIHESVLLPISLSVRPSSCLSVHKSVLQSISLSVCLSYWLSILLSVHHSIPRRSVQLRLASPPIRSTIRPSARPSVCPSVRQSAYKCF